MIKKWQNRGEFAIIPCTKGIFMGIDREFFVRRFAADSGVNDSSSDGDGAKKIGTWIEEVNNRLTQHFKGGVSVPGEYYDGLTLDAPLMKRLRGNVAAEHREE
jgi:hypothetical protein